MAQAGKLDEKIAKSMPGLIKNKVHTFESILSDMKVLMGEKYEIEMKMEKCKAVFKAVAEDDLDSYIESLKVGAIDTVSRAKLKRRLAELRMELNKLDKLLAVAKPKDFSVEEWTMKISEGLVMNKKEEMESEPIKVQLKVTEEVQSTEVEVVEKVEKVKEPIVASDQNTKVENVENVIEKNEPKKRSHKEPRKEENRNELEENIENDKGDAKKQKVKEEYEEYSNSTDYAVWLPPESKLF